MSNRKTIANNVVFSGKALQSGRQVTMTCLPAAAGSGVVFKRKDLPQEPEIRLGGGILSDNENRRSTLAMGAVQVQTVEHFLAALWALEIDDLLIEINAIELPAGDGAATGFLARLKEAGTRDLDEPKKAIRITEEIRVEDGARSLIISPAEIFSVSYHIDYKVPSIGQADLEMVLDPETFEKEIAPARTFCLKKEALFLFLSGLGRGATLQNTLVMGKKGPMGTKLRFSDEPIRHKILDLVGDLYMLGRPLVGKVTADRSGHNLNTRLVKKIYEKYVKNKG